MKLLMSICLTIAMFSSVVGAQTYWTKVRKQALTKVLAANAYNSTWFTECVRDAGGILNTVTAKSIVLAGHSASRQFLLTGKIISGHEACAYGARSPLNWIIEEDGSTFRVLADIGAADKVRILGSTTNGYRNIRIGSISAAGRQWDTAILKFDGSLYK